METGNIISVSTTKKNHSWPPPTHVHNVHNTEVKAKGTAQRLCAFTVATYKCHYTNLPSPRKCCEAEITISDNETGTVQQD